MEKYFLMSREEFLLKIQYIESEWQFDYGFSAIDGSDLLINYYPGGVQVMKQYHNLKAFTR